MQATALTEQEAADFTGALRRMGLPRRPSDDPGDEPRFTPLTGGVSSLIVRADFAGQSVCIKRALAQLKVASEWKAPVERSDAEAAWLATAATIVPEAVPRVLGHDAVTRAFAMEYLDPAHYPVWKTQLLAGHADPATAHAVAAALAAIHNATARRDDMAARFANHANFFALRLEPYFSAAARAHPARADVLESLIARTDGTRLALIHGDVSPKNILVGPRHPVLVDAECATFGDPAFDVAFCLNHLLLKCVWRPGAAASYLQSFDTFARTYLDAVGWEPRELIEQRVATLLPALLLARVDGKSPVEYLTGERERETVRGFALRALAALPAPDAALAGLQGQWHRHIQDSLLQDRQFQ